MKQKFTPEQWETGSYRVFTRDGKTVHRLHKTIKGYTGIVDGFHYEWCDNGCLPDHSKHSFDLFLVPVPRSYWKQAIEVLRDMVCSWIWVY